MAQTQESEPVRVVKGADEAVLDGFVITGGRADGGGVDNRGGGMYNEGCEPVVRNCKFSENYAAYGGGMANYSGSKPVLDGCIFEDNIAALGGGMYNDRSAPELSRCVFSENQGEGAGMCNWGVGANPLVVNCVFTGSVGVDVYNTAQYEDFNNVPVFTNCTFNRAGNTVMYNLFSAPTVTNCILWTGSASAVQTYIRADASFRCCDIKGSGGSGNWNNSFGRDGGYNIDENPEFVDASKPAGTVGNEWFTADDGLRLQDISPCIDKADGDFAPARDIIGVQRYDEGDPGGGVGTPDYADIGAYEYHPAVVHFCGGLISDVRDDTKEWSEAFVDDDWSEFKGVGEYASTAVAIPKATWMYNPQSTLDCIAIREGMKLTVYSQTDFGGIVLLEQRGPAVIYNLYWHYHPKAAPYLYTVEAMTKDWAGALQIEFPQSVRKWSATNMYDSQSMERGDYWWGIGSFKIE